MVETVLVMPFIALALVLIVYLGWNFRRLAQVSNMDRYVIWESATPGAPGPDIQGINADIRNPHLNSAFFGLNSDHASQLDELRWTNNVPYMPRGHREFRDQQADEAYSYFDEFLDRNPTGIMQRFKSAHPQSVNTDFLGLSDLTGNGIGHSRMNGDWRYLNGIGYNSAKNKWEPDRRRVSPGGTLREIFFAELVDGLEPYANNGNELARAISNFYLRYPVYIGPELELDDDDDDDDDLPQFPTLGL